MLAVPGDDRLTWLHLVLTQHVSELPAEAGTEALVLDVNGRVLHHAAVAHVDGVVWLDTEPGEAPELLDYLDKMGFWSKVEPRDASAELAVLSVVGPDTAAVLEAGASLPPRTDAPPERRPAGCWVGPPDPWPAPDAADLLVPRADQDAWWARLTAAGARPAGTMAFEALRVEALAPRLGVDTDDRTIPHEVGWIPSAVHLTKGPTAARRPSPGWRTWAAPPAASSGSTSTPATSTSRPPATRCSGTAAPSAGSARSSSTTSWARSRWPC